MCRGRNHSLANSRTHLIVLEEVIQQVVERIR